MNVLIDINHPAHVHLFRNVYSELIKKGHHVYVAAKPTNAITALLRLYGIPYLRMGKNKDSIIGKTLIVNKEKGDYLKLSDLE